MNKIVPYLNLIMLGLYIILAIYTNNIEKVTIGMMGRSVLVMLLLSFVVSLLVWKLEHKEKWLLYGFSLLGLFYFYGLVYEIFSWVNLQGLWPFKHIHRHLILLFGAFSIFLFIRFKKSKKNFGKTHSFISLLLSLLIIYNVFLLIKFELTSLSFSNPFLKERLSYSSFEPISEKPDVYLIILDGYAREDILKNYFEFDNSQFIKGIKSRNFEIADSSVCNYPLTAESMSSILNMNHVFEYRELIKSSNEMIYDNLVFKAFKELGYKIVTLESGYSVTESFKESDIVLSIQGLNEFERALVELTALKLLGAWGYIDYWRLSNQFKALDQIVKIAGPKFSFIHLITPHAPFVVDENGNKKKRTASNEGFWEPKSEYLDQLTYTNQVVLGFIDTIQDQTKNAIIILMSDHGPWLRSNEALETFYARTGILFAINLPQEEVQFPADFTPVNTFRYVFNYLFGIDIPLAPNDTYNRQMLIDHPVYLKNIN